MYGCFNEGLKVNEIQELWSEVFQRDPLTNRQLYLYREKWVEGGRRSGIDSTVRWPDRKSFVDYGINIDHLPLLNDVDNWIGHEFRGFLPKLSYRLLYWCSYVLSLAPELENELDLFVLGAQFALRNMVYSYTRRHGEETDLDDLLSYRPWRSNERDEKYRAYRPKHPPLTSRPECRMTSAAARVYGIRSVLHSSHCTQGVLCYVITSNQSVKYYCKLLFHSRLTLWR